jgi:hypothetical protein
VFDTVTIMLPLPVRFDASVTVAVSICAPLAIETVSRLNVGFVPV